MILKRITVQFLNNPRLQLLLLLLGILPYFYIAQYIHPAGDDLSYSVKTWYMSFADAYPFEYFQHNGRYFSNLLVLMNPLSSYNIVLYKVIPVILLLFLVLAFFVFFRAAFSTCISNIKTILLSLVFVLIFLMGMPDLAEGLYWYTGSVSYTAGYIPLLMYASLVLLVAREYYLFKSRLFHHSLMIVLLFITCGFNEVLTIFMIGLHGFAALYEFVQEKKINRILLLYFCLSLSFLLLMLMAPGNNIRADKYPVKYELIESLGIASLHTLRFISEWLSNASLWLLAALMLPLFSTLLGKGEAIHPLLRAHPVLIFSFLVFLTFLSAFLPCYGTGQLGQHRTINTAWFFFMSGWIGIWISVYYRMREHADWIEAAYKRFHLSIKTVLLIVLVFAGNSYTVLYDIQTGKAKVFDKEMFGRYQRIQFCMAMENLVCDVPYLKNKPESIFVYDLQPDPKHWLNRCYSVYYRKRELLVRGY